MLQTPQINFRHSQQLPYWGRLPDGSQPGTMITIEGTPTRHANRFAINLVIGDAVDASRDHHDIALHFNPRFHEGYVVRNSRQNLTWQTEEWAPKRLPFHKGTKFSILILVEATSYKIAVDNQHFVEFRHRLPVDLACLLHIEGDVAIDRIQFHSASGAGSGMMTPAYAPVAGVPTVTAGFLPYSGPPTPGIQYSQSMGVPVLPSGPVATVFSHHGPQVFNNPSMPFMHKVMGGFKPGLKITVHGKPTIGFDGFGIDLCKSVTNEIALQVNPRNLERAVVRNTKTVHGWGKEERDTPSFPFMFGSFFVLEIRVEHNRYVILANDKYFADFHHRMQPLHLVDLIKVWGDVNLTSASVSNDF